MNTFGRLFRLHIFGESHGSHLGVTLQGLPAGLPLLLNDFTEDILRRMPQHLASTPRKEADVPMIISGHFKGKSTGAPLTILFKNLNTRSKDYDSFRQTPRPGHADFVATHKYGGHEDYRGGGHFSGRMTLALVAAGVVAKKMIMPVRVHASLLEAGGYTNIEEGLQKAIEAQDSIGGIIGCKTENLPIGLGEPFFDSVESLISHAVFSVPAVKAIGFGSGFQAAGMWGSQHNDALLNETGETATQHAGGIVGGLTNGNPLCFKVAVKPSSSTPVTQKTWNRNTRSMEEMKVTGRHDLCIALRAPVVIEAITACVMADLLLLAQKIPAVRKAS